MSSTISGASTIGVTLSTNPTTITGTINAASGPAIYGAAPTSWTLINQGLLETQFPRPGIPIAGGIVLAGGGSIYNAATGVINAYPYGIRLGASGTIVNAGKITSRGDYGVDITLPSGQLTNAATGIISGGQSAIKFGAGTTILNQGVIQSTNGYGWAVYGSGGLITNQSGATISGRSAVELIDADTLINAGLIATRFPSYGVAVQFAAGAGNILQVDPGSTIIGAIAGFIAGDTIDLAGAIATSAVFSAGFLTLSTGDTIFGTFSLSGDLNTGEFVLSPDGAGGTGVTLGAETVTGFYGAGFYLTALSTTIAPGATITSGNNALTGSADRPWSLVNAGTIATNGPLRDRFAVLLDNFASFENESSGLVGGAGGVALGGVGGTLVNFGTAVGTGGVEGIALLFDGPAYLGYGAGGHAAARNVTAILEPGSSLVGAIGGFDTGNTIDLAGVVATSKNFANGILTLSNRGTRVATLAFDGNFNNAELGIFSDQHGGTDITLAAQEKITGTYTAGVVLSAPFTTITSTATVTNAESTIFPQTGVYSGEGGVATLVNAGVIAAVSAFGIGVQLDDGGLINNKTGTIIGTHYGAELFDGTLINAGTLASTGTGFGSAGFLGGSGPGVELLNTGLVTGLTGAILFGATINNRAGGIISGATAVSMYQGILQNAGTIESTTGVGGVAVAIGGAGASLVVDPGAVFIGAITDGGAPRNVLEFAAGTPATFAGIGSTVTGFRTIAIARGGHWTIEGDTAGLTSGQTITGFVPTNTIVIQSFQEISAHIYYQQATATTASNRNLVISNGTAQETLAAFTGTAADTGVLLVSAANNNTTIALNNSAANLSLPAYTYSYVFHKSSITNTTVANHATLEVEGAAINTTVLAGGSENVGQRAITGTPPTAGVTNNTTLAGGELTIFPGANATGTITMLGGANILNIDGTSSPSALISGFTACDQITVADIPTSAAVSVEKTGVVTISGNGHIYYLKIAGATIGATNFHFANGTLTTSIQSPAMGFLRPPEPAAATTTPTSLSPPNPATASPPPSPTTPPPFTGWYNPTTILTPHPPYMPTLQSG